MDPPRAGLFQTNGYAHLAGLRAVSMSTSPCLKVLELVHGRKSLKMIHEGVILPFYVVTISTGCDRFIFLSETKPGFACSSFLSCLS